MNNNLQAIRDNCQVISEEFSATIKGGTGTVESGLSKAQLMAMFNYGTIVPGETGDQAQQDGFNSATGQVWNLIVENMYATPAGKYLLDQMYANLQNNQSNRINLENKQPGSGFAEYKSGTNEMLIGGLTPFNNDIFHPNSNVDTTASVAFVMNTGIHELFHAYSDIVTGNVKSVNGGNVTGELDAYMYSMIVLREFDNKMNTGNAYEEGARDSFYRLLDNETPNAAAMASAMIYGRAFNLSNYNLMISDITAGSAFKNLYKNMNYSQMADLSKDDLNIFFQNYYKTVPAPGLSNANSTEWYNPQTGLFEQTVAGQLPDSGFNRYIRTNDSNISQLVTDIINVRTYAGDVPIRNAVSAGVQAAINAEAQGLSSTAIHSAGISAANAVVGPTNTPGGEPGSAPPTGGGSSGPSAGGVYYYGVDPYTNVQTNVYAANDGTFVVYGDNSDTQYTTTGTQTSDTATNTASSISSNTYYPGQTTTWYNPSTESYFYLSPGQQVPSGASFVHSDNTAIENSAATAYNNAIMSGATVDQANMAVSAAASAAQTAVSQGQDSSQVAASANAASNQVLNDLDCTPLPQGTTPNPDNYSGQAGAYGTGDEYGDFFFQEEFYGYYE